MTNLVGSASSNPRLLLSAATDDPSRHGEAVPSRFDAIKDPELCAAFTAAYDAWERQQDQLSIFSEAA